MYINKEIDDGNKGIGPMYLQRSRVAESLEVHLILTSSLSAMSNGFAQ